MNGSVVCVFTGGCLEAVLECFHLKITENPFTTGLGGNEKVPRCLVWWTWEEVVRGHGCPQKHRLVVFPSTCRPTFRLGFCMVVG